MGQKISIKTKHQDLPVIRTRGLGKTYPNGTRALKNVDFTLQHNEFVSIIGSSGAGKSTFLRCLNRLITPTEGMIELNGKDITYGNGSGLKKVRQKVGMIFQQFNLVPRLSVLNNVLAGRLRFNQGPISYGSSIIRLFSKLEKEIAFECLKQVGIEHFAFQRADTLSGGQQQRVAIARTLAQEPNVFLADEPISSLDPRSAEKVMEILLQINQSQKIPVIVNLHHIDFALRYGRRIIGMADGEMIFDGKGKDMTPDTVAWVYQGLKEGETETERIRACA
ncbi:MAG: phosphonate ABC transporter ATP-binding protein [Desulfobacula sp.]|uniref:phosphonate ABC transporter ATP-binding protein n=1 Tax=Desulfobacula sp. TaxID=2593537 RepID=UPI0025B9F1A5|nr:phosphonate ABC transporter ATP-binding protein [Desulfobacula sp.]MCD4719426.1 phosphonate ABC transporter ATP-binding protein [Desulfobacula sp.]